ncbi:hypothetical protein C8R46DRAFT_1356393 [Mycena filopes]|nr:hypothetical protein C8R46DRAFT_1356393 [Mycena filopes]
MHPALGITEIREMICGAVGNPLNPESATLEALALTCIAFLDPALDALWWDATAPRLLIHCMPDDLWESFTIGDGPSAQIVYWPTRAMVPDDWERSRYYAKRIRVMTTDNWLGLDFTDVFAAVAICPPPPGIFPNLHTLAWYYHIMLPDFRSFLGPRISKLSVGSLFAGSPLSLLPHIARECPTLKELCITSDVAHLARQVSAISALVVQLHHLEVLEVHHLDPPALLHIGRLPSLRYLTVHTVEGVPAVPTRGAPLFPALRQFSAFFIPIVGAIAFLRLTPTLRLVRYNAEFTTCATPEEIETFYTALATHCAHAPLQELTVGISSLFELVLPIGASGLYSLTPLLCFANLRIVELSSPLGFDLDDSALSDLAQAWPHLQDLMICAVDPGPPRVTLGGLRALAQYCPWLSNLQLGLDATAVPSGPQHFVQLSLMYLHVENAGITAPLLVAEFLASLFPSLWQVNTQLENLELTGIPAPVVQRHQGWKKVEGLLPYVF